MKQLFSLLLTIAAMTALAQQPAAPKALEPDEHTAAFWTFSKLENGLVKDESGFGNDLTPLSKTNAPKNGETAAAPAVSGEGGVFDGNGGSFTINKVKESLRISKGDFAVEVVFKAATEEALKKFDGFYFLNNKPYTDAVGGLGFGYSPYNGRKFFFYYAVNGEYKSFAAPLTQPLKAGQWYYVKVSRKGTKLSISLDDLLLKEEEIPGTISLVNPRPLAIGVYQTAWQRTKDGKLITNGFIGTINSIRISDIAR